MKSKTVPELAIGTQCIIANVYVVADVDGAFEWQREPESVKSAVPVEEDHELLSEQRREFANSLQVRLQQKRSLGRVVRWVRHVRLVENGRCFVHQMPVGKLIGGEHDDQLGQYLKCERGLATRLKFNVPTTRATADSIGLIVPAESPRST